MQERMMQTIQRVGNYYYKIGMDMVEKLKPFLAMSVILLPILVYIVRKYKTKEEVEEEELLKFITQERVDNNSNVVLKDWRAQTRNCEPGLPKHLNITWTKEELLTVVKKASFKVRAFATLDQHTCLYGVVYDAKHVIVNRHLVTYPKVDMITLEDVYGKSFFFTLNNCDYKVLLDASNVRFLDHSDLMVVTVVGLSHSAQIRKFVTYVFEGDTQSVDGASYVNCEKILDFKIGDFNRSRHGMNLGCEGSQITEYGDCGGVYIYSVDVQQKYWKVGAIHWAFAGKCIGAVITSSSVDQLILTMGLIPQGTTTMLSTFVKPGVEPSYKNFGRFSEIDAAERLLKIQIPNFGTMNPPPSASTIKFKTQKSLICDEPLVREYERLWCGEENYWRTPLAKKVPAANEINYDSCYINSFKTINVVEPDSFFLHLALIDYLQNMKSLNNRGYAILSNDQVIRGVPGSFIHSVNMKTSVGPPYNTGKSKFVTYDLSGSYVDPIYCLAIEDMERELLAGNIVATCGICIPKDEPNKPDKFTRIFTSLPYSFNFLMKKYGGAMKSFIRCNPEYFESMVGTNMTGLECNRVVELLRKNDPLLENLFDADIKAMDKSWSPHLYEIVAKAVYAISFYLGINAKVNYTLVQSLLHVKYSIQGDLFSASWNPSGNDWTVEMNGLLLSICARYVYYKCCGTTITKEQVQDYMKDFFDDPIKDLKGCNYREFNSLVTYGDDNVQSVRWVIPSNYFDIWLVELGMTVTPADKTKLGVSLVGITGIQFLKRTFKYNSEFGCYVAALDKKSMIRMLLMKKPSSLSGTDHVCISCSEFLREMFLHSKEEFQDWQQKIVNLLTNKGWINNRYFINKPYDYWASQFLCGEFYTWVEHDLSTNFIEYTNLIYQMNTNNNEQGSSIESSVVLEATQNQIATFVATDPAVIVGSTNTNMFLQKMPEATLDMFLTRPVEIANVVVSNGDTPMFPLTVLDPITLMFTNVAVQEKIKNFTYYRGTVQVIVRIAVPPGTYGLYMVSAMPRNNAVAASLISDYLVTENVLQPIHVVIDIAKCTEAVLQLPWIYDRDFSLITVTSLWDLFFTCYQPIATGIAGAFTTGNMKVYVNFLDDYKLVVPHYQGKLENNDALKKFAPKVHKAIGNGQGSKLMGVIENIASQAKGIPIIGAMASTVEMTAGVAKNILSYFGFTRHSNQLMPIPITMRSVTNVANCDGNDASEVAALMRSNTLSVDPMLIGGNEEDLLSNNYLFSKFTLVSVIPWSTASGSGTVLGSVPVTPSFHRRDATLRRHFTTAGFIGLPFEYWRGSMEYLIMIPVSVFHRGTLQILWSQDNFSLTADPTNVTFNYVYNVAADENQILTIDYVKSEPMAQNRIISGTDTISPLGVANGAIVFRVVNPLLAQAAVASTNIYVFARAGPDMEFSKPRDLFIADDGLGAVVSYSVYSDLAIQGALGDGPVLETSTPLVVSKNNYPIDLICMGERFESLRALIQKPCKINSIASPIGGAFLLKPYLYYRPGFNITGTEYSPTTYASYYLSFYIGVSGSERWKFIGDANSAYIGASRTESTGSTLIFPTFLDPISYVGSNRGMEFLIPYYYPKKFITPLISGTGAVNSTRIATTNTTACRYLTYYSMGPDVKVIGFRQVPSLLIIKTGGVYPPWF
jgi:hypothetical protein